MRPLTLFSAWLLALMVGCIPTSPPPGPAPTPPGPIRPEGPADGELLGLHNAERAKVGLPALAWDNRLASAATVQVGDCAGRDVLTHTGSDGSTVLDRTRRAGWPTATVGENAAQQGPVPPDWPGADPRTVAWAMEGWMASPGHRANVLGPWTHLGSAVADSRSGRRYRVVAFGRLSP